jgi:broad specificity phosphatase PhoE
VLSSYEEVVERVTTQFSPLEAAHPVIPLPERVVIIRHAERLDEVFPEWGDLADRPQDSPLTDRGIQQAKILGEWVAGSSWVDNIGGVFVSPFVRTVQTAHFATEHPKLAHARLLVEYGLAEGADWMAHNTKCKTPWHLKAADLYCVSRKIDLSYESYKHPLFSPGESYPGRPREGDKWYDRCAQTVWRICRSEQYANKTLLLVTHGGCVDNFGHALSGCHLSSSPGHTSVTSYVRDATGRFVLEKAERAIVQPIDSRSGGDSNGSSGSSGSGGSSESSESGDSDWYDIQISQHHLPKELRTGLFYKPEEEVAERRSRWETG